MIKKILLIILLNKGYFSKNFSNMENPGSEFEILDNPESQLISNHSPLKNTPEQLNNTIIINNSDNIINEKLPLDTKPLNILSESTIKPMDFPY